MAIRRANDGSAMVVADVTTTDGKGEKLGAILSANLLENGELPISTWRYAAAAGGIVSSTTGVTIVAAPSATAANYVRSIQIATDNLGAATEFVIRDGAGGTVLWRCRLLGNTLATNTINLDPALKGSAGNLIEVAAITAVAGGIYINAQGYTA